ncbi:hypothetical protein FRC02_012219 [Tulasnella sp. 418]|nr:hypothetical protein FRC02_012219 [Tulasnella sp. 418]
MFRRLESVPEFTSQVNPGTLDLNGIRHILGLNEPQEPSQGLIEPQAGADAWKSVLEPLKQANPSLRLGAPAVSNGPSGKIWLQQWFAACNGGCSVDFVPVHWYGLNASDFIAHVYDFHYTFQRPIWVTEWASHNFGDPALGQFSQEQVNEFLRNTQAFLDSTDFVERYAWFGAMLDTGNVSPANRLMSPEGTITDLGRQYISAQPPVQTTTQPITTTAATSTPLSSVVTTSPVTSTPTSSTVTSTATTRNGTIVIQTNQAFHTLIPFWTILVVSAVLALNSHVIPFI